jgi:hypothetical protein
MSTNTAVLLLLSARLFTATAADSPLPRIEKVEIGENAELRVNGQPFLPLMLWLQSDARIPDGLAAGINTFTGNGGQLSEKAYLDALAGKGLYGVVSFEKEAIGHSHLLGWIHGDEPDLPSTINDAQVTAGPSLRVNRSTPLERLVDGVTHSWSVLDPLQDAEVTITLRKPAVITHVSIWLTISPGLAIAKEVSFVVDGQSVLDASLRPEKGEQKFTLPKPVQAKSLTLRVRSTVAGKQDWGSVSEIAAYDAAGNNVLLSPPRVVPRATVEEVAKEFSAIKQADTSRPVFVTFTAHFMQAFTKYDATFIAESYPGYVASCDVAGFDVYPIFGWGKPEWLPRVAEGVTELRAIAGPRRPLYAWIETNKGSKWVSPEKQPDVRPQDTRAEVWMALIRGATAIGYFTHRWVPDYRQFAPEGEMVTELRRLNTQITRLAPALLASRPTAQIRLDTADVPGHFKATELDRFVYVFAQNIDIRGRDAAATFSVPGLAAGTQIEVVDEDRTITAAANSFRDTFPPLAEHVYRWPVQR